MFFVLIYKFSYVLYYPVKVFPSLGIVISLKTIVLVLVNWFSWLISNSAYKFQIQQKNLSALIMLNDFKIIFKFLINPFSYVFWYSAKVFQVNFILQNNIFNFHLQIQLMDFKYSTLNRKVLGICGPSIDTSELWLLIMVILLKLHLSN